MQPRGRGRGRSNRPPRGNPSNTHSRPHHHPDHPAYTTVPPHASLHPGSSVSIILKQDQPTGHQVTGIVAALLTRSDHPRGVKVRLRDGRVGRVQGLVSADEGARGEASVGGEGAGVGRNGEGAAAAARMLGGRVERDVRELDEYLYDEGRSAGGGVSLGVFGALEEADRRHAKERKGGGGGVVGGGESEVVRCPVCGEFEGDERAVAFHVEEHFAG